MLAQYYNVNGTNITQAAYLSKTIPVEKLGDKSTPLVWDR